MHAAHKTIGVSPAAAALPACDGPSVGLPDKLRRPLRVCLVAGSTERRLHESYAELEQYLQRHCNLECCRSFRTADCEPAEAKNRRTPDCALLIGRPAAIEKELLWQLEQHCRLGGPIVGVRSAGYALQDPLQMGPNVFGVDYRGRHGNQSTQVEVVQQMADHPVLAGVEPFVSQGALERNFGVARDAVVLLRGNCDHGQHPVAWTRKHNGGRVFYTSLGHPEDFRHDSFRKLLANALFWAGLRERP